jgi:hypothetical protein
MNRRRFLTLFAAAAGAAIVAPAIPAARVWSFPSLIEKLFRWRSTAAGVIVPNEVPISLGAGAGGNQFLTINWISYESLVKLEKNLRFSELPGFDDLPAAAIGSTIGVKVPLRLRLGYPVREALEDEIYSGAPPGRPPVNQLKSPRFPFRPAFGIPES